MYLRLVHLLSVSAFLLMTGAPNLLAGDGSETLPAPPAITEHAPATCQASTVADVYTVTQLSQCGQPLSNSYLRGVINRARRCTVETKLADVFANPCTCESCTASSKVQQIRCARGNCMVCSNDEYLKALIQDLADPSLSVRVAAQRSLRLCDLRVTHVRACVQERVPAIVLY